MIDMTKVIVSTCSVLLKKVIIHNRFGDKLMGNVCYKFLEGNQSRQGKVMQTWGNMQNVT